MTAEEEVELRDPTLVSADLVAQYLRSHPEFFNEYPGVLRDLTIPHASGGAVSLFERQVSALREENGRLKERFEDLVRLAMENEGLNSRIHQLALELMAAAGPQAIFNTLEQRLSEDFDADRVVTLIFAERAFADGEELPQFTGKQAASREPFKAMFVDRKALCGRLNQAQNASLFGDIATPGSTVVLPLLGSGWDGVVAVNSNDTARFDQDMSTDFLTYLSDIVILVLDPWIARTPRA